MAWSKREQYIGLGAMGALGLLVLNSFVINPYFDQLAQVDQDQTKAESQLQDADDIFAAQARLSTAWQKVLKDGLKPDPSAAESVAHHAVLDWAQSAGVSIVSLGRPEVSTEGKFQVIKLTVNATGSMASVSRMLWSMETGNILLRINDVQLSSRREGTDELSFRFVMSTICMPPDTKSGAANPAGASVAATNEPEGRS